VNLVNVGTMLRRWVPWGEPWGNAATNPRRNVSGTDEDATNERRRLLLEHTYTAAQEQERELRAAAERIQAELDVLRREH
jgi:hypothetical protein